MNKTLLQNFGLALVYFLVAKICQSFAIKPGNITPIWASSGICFIWVYLKGYKLLPGVFIGAFLGNVSAYIFPIASEKLLNAVASGLFNGVGDVLCTLIGVYLFKKINQNKSILADIRSALTFVFLSSILGPVVSAFFGVSGLYLFDIIPKGSFNVAFITWFIGDAIGVLILVPLLENILNSKKNFSTSLSKGKLLEITIGLIVISLVINLALSNSGVSSLESSILILILLPTLAIAAFRYNEFTVNSLVLAVSVIILYFTISNHSPEQYTNGLNSALIYSQILIFSVATTIYLLLASISKIHFLNKEIVKKDRLANLGLMSAGVAHEINNPLFVILTSLKVVKTNFNNIERRDELISIIENASGRISKIVKGLNRYSYQNTEIETINTSLKKIIEDSLVLIELNAKKYNVKVLFNRENPAYDKLCVNCDPILIQQVIINFVNNAIDEIKEDDEKWVRVEIDINPNNYKVRVIDSGDGIDESVRHSLFVPFYTTKKIGDGTGLGLSISKGIIEDHNGLIGTEQYQGNTCFWFELPKA